MNTSKSKIKELPVVRDSLSDYDRIEAEILKVLREEFYIPLLLSIGAPKATIKNSIDDLIIAIHSGRITFSMGKFQGKFNSNISRELRGMGATFDRKSGAYKIILKDIPIDVRNAISVSEFKFDEKIKSLNRKLQQIVPEEIAEKVNISKFIDKTLFKYDSEIQKSLKSITVSPKLTEEHRKKIADEYTNNLKLKIRGWTAERVIKLREEVKKNVMAGYRYEVLADIIKKEYKVGAKKAKFLARQETNLLLSKFKEARYTSSGIHEYKWRCVKGTALHPVRPMHQILNDRSAKGELFRFDEPPIDDPSGGRHNPGEAYNCRCESVPVIRFNR